MDTNTPRIGTALITAWTLDLSRRINRSSKMQETIHKAVYIAPYPDSLGKYVSLRVVWLLWLLNLAIKILCQDSDWGFFLIATGLLLLFSIQFFIVSLSGR